MLQLGVFYFYFFIFVVCFLTDNVTVFGSLILA